MQIPGRRGRSAIGGPGGTFPGPEHDQDMGGPGGTGGGRRRGDPLPLRSALRRRLPLGVSQRRYDPHRVPSGVRRHTGRCPGTASAGRSDGQPDQVVAGNACIVGDAAGLVNPVSFGGIRTALVSGRMAADAIARKDLGLYQTCWKRSGFADPIFMAGYQRLAKMNNGEMARSIRPYKGGVTAFNHAKAMLKHPEFREFTAPMAFRSGTGGNYGLAEL